MKGVRRNAIILIGITVCCKCIGFFRNSVLAYYWGTGPVVDAYVMIFAIGNIVFGWMTGLTGNFTPSYKKVYVEKGRESANRFTSNVLGWLIIITLICSLLFRLFDKQIIMFAAPGFKGETFEVSLSFWRIYSSGLVIVVIYRLFKEYLNCNEAYIQAIWPDLLMSSICIVAIILSYYTDKTVLIGGYLVAFGMEAFIGIWNSRKRGFRYTFELKINDDIKTMIVAIIPIFLGDTIVEINTLIDKMFASSLESGTVAVLDYANTLKIVFAEAGYIVITTIIYPYLSQLWSENKREEFADKLTDGIRIIIVHFVPVFMGIIAIGKIVVDIVYLRGAFTVESVEMTYISLCLYSVGLVFNILSFLFVKAFCAMRNTKIVLLGSFVNLIVNVGLNIILVKKYGYKGLAISTSVAVMFGALFYMFVVYATFKKSLKALAILLCKVVIGTAVMGMIIIMLREKMMPLLDNNIVGKVFGLFLLASIGMIAYYGLMRILRVEEIKLLIKTERK